MKGVMTKRVHCRLLLSLSVLYLSHLGVYELVCYEPVLLLTIPDPSCKHRPCLVSIILGCDNTLLLTHTSRPLPVFNILYSCQHTVNISSSSHYNNHHSFFVKHLVRRHYCRSLDYRGDMNARLLYRL